MKVLAITNLFPNQKEPGRGVFNKQQFIPLSKLCELRVVAPLPWTPIDLVKEETIDGIQTYHPRYLVIPKIGRMRMGQSFYDGIKNTIQEISKEFDFDVILGTWAYPDAYAASLIAKKLSKPLIVKVHGTDINLGIEQSWRRKKITEALENAKHVIAVSSGLKEKIIGLGINSEKIAVIPNGVNAQVFFPQDKMACRKALGLSKDIKYILFVGNLVTVKGIKYLVDAMKALPNDVHLNIIGDGELKTSLEQLSSRLGVAQRVFFKGRVAHKEIATWINASNVLCLPSLNEGCPNVVLESLACQVPVVGTNVGGIPELIDTKQKGMIVPAQSPAQLADAIQKILEHPSEFQIDSSSIASWEKTAQDVLNILKTTL
jgi:teichuronic acid biosynthesis glycosyltransferase TuaC